MKSVNVMPLIYASGVLFILAVFIAHRPGDITQMLALACGLGGYMTVLCALMVHMVKPRFSRNGGVR